VEVKSGLKEGDVVVEWETGWAEGNGRGDVCRGWGDEDGDIRMRGRRGEGEGEGGKGGRGRGEGQWRWERTD
jgi:hypothetical protein